MWCLCSLYSLYTFVPTETTDTHTHKQAWWHCVRGIYLAQPEDTLTASSTVAYCSFKHNFCTNDKERDQNRGREAELSVDKSTPPTHSWTGPLPQHFLPLSASRRGQVSHWASHGPTMAFTPHNIITDIYWWNRSISSTMKNEIMKFLLKLNLGELSETPV